VTDMTPDKTKALVRRHFEEFVNRKNHDIVFETMSDDYLDHDGPGGRPTDREGGRRMMIEWHHAMPDLRLTIEDMIAEGDKVVCRNVWTATYKNGKPFHMKGIVIWRLVAGRLVERWASVDTPST
jgi:predicted ester cyclase